MVLPHCKEKPLFAKYVKHEMSMSRYVEVNDKKTSANTRINVCKTSLVNMPLMKKSDNLH